MNLDIEALKIEHPDILRKGKAYFVYARNAHLAWDQPIAGPFERKEAAAWWIAENYQGKLTDEQRAVWADVLDAIGGAHADPYHALQLCSMIGAGVDEGRLWKFAIGGSKPRKIAPRAAHRTVEDFKERAAGSQEVA